MHWRNYVKENGCAGALEWVDSQPSLSAQQMWEACTRPDWMLWWVGTSVGPAGGERWWHDALLLAQIADACVPEFDAGHARRYLAHRGEGENVERVLADIDRCCVRDHQHYNLLGWLRCMLRARHTLPITAMRGFATQLVYFDLVRREEALRLIRAAHPLPPMPEGVEG